MAAQVALLMGSDSDWKVMEECAKALIPFGLEVEVRVMSAHRTPAEAGEFARTARERGVKVIIAAAGGAAHLAGAMAAHSPLPVIGVPLAATPLAGLDALLATVQMPPGVPVATVGIGQFGAANAAVLAAQIIAVGDPAVAAKIDQYKKDMATKVRAKDQKIQAEWQKQRAAQ
ncbi:MAG: 5-(carboxyamino)imidazole ribonucleotide mutase [Planctomycetota bacterium]